MLVEPPPGVRAPRDDGQALGASLVDRSCDQPPTDAMTLELLGYFGVQEQKLSVFNREHKLSSGPVHIDDEGVVYDGN
jgi:hypothetical protein